MDDRSDIELMDDDDEKNEAEEPWPQRGEGLEASLQIRWKSRLLLAISPQSEVSSNTILACLTV